MQSAMVIKGRLTGPKSVELDEAVANADGEVEVIVRMNGGAKVSQGPGISEFLCSIPAGTRSKDDIDRQIQEERQVWGER